MTCAAAVVLLRLKLTATRSPRDRSGRSRHAGLVTLLAIGDGHSPQRGRVPSLGEPVAISKVRRQKSLNFLAQLRAVDIVISGIHPRKNGFYATSRDSFISDLQ